MKNITMPDKPARTVRLSVPSILHDRLKHLAIDLGRPLNDIYLDGAILMARYHGAGEGLPEPLAPKGEVAR
jgi:S-adenosylmethionine:diacylglycerol 3-amino-3-carboxypropyl transferase